MRNPSITDYVSTMENPTGVFRTLGEVEAERDVYRDIYLRSGNSAAVFTYMRGGLRRFLKCYIRPNPHLRAVYDYVESIASPLFPEVRLLRDEVYVYSLSGEEGWTDIVEGQWVEGETLDNAIACAVGNGHAIHLRELAEAFDALCRMLLAQEWAHGDLKPENIVVRSDGSLVLIDCDAMWIPAFAGLKAVELGTPGFRHPARDASLFDRHIDDYSMLLISASLHALALEPGLYAKYNTTDNLILSPGAVVEGNCAAHAEMLGLLARAGMAREYRMAEALASPYYSTATTVAEVCFDRQHPIPAAGELTSFVENGKWGFENRSGLVAVAPLWDEVLEFRGGLAALRLGEWWNVVDLSGKVVLTGLFYEEMCRLRKK